MMNPILAFLYAFIIYHIILYAIIGAVTTPFLILGIVTKKYYQHKKKHRG